MSTNIILQDTVLSHNALVPVSLQALILISNRKPIILKIGALIQQKSDPLQQKCHMSLKYILKSIFHFIFHNRTHVQAALYT